MARIRTIKPEFFTSEQIVECSTSARLLFVGMWCFCDDGGIHPASLKRLKMEVFPGDSISDDELALMIQELIDNRLICEFDEAGSRFWCVLGWKSHQKIDRPTYKHPQLTDEQIEKFRLGVDDHSDTPRRAFDEHSTSPRDGMESNGMESNGEDKDKSVTNSNSAEEPKTEEAEQKPSIKRFIPPTVDEVRAYCNERRNSVDASKFVDFYESKGWMVGKSKMKDWRASVRTWERGDAGTGKTNAGRTDSHLADDGGATDRLLAKLFPD